MPRFVEYDLRALGSLRQRLTENLEGTTNLEESAQICASTLFEEFSQSAALVRVFASTTFAELPTRERDFVTRLATARGASSELNERTPVICLLGTRGFRDRWNDRRRSQNHLAIPLLRASFVKTLPMISRLMTDLGTGVEWIEKQTTLIVVKSIGRMAQLLYVEDAATAETRDGFKIVAAQDFVAAHRIKTVLGMGGAYPNRAFVAIAIFAKESFSQAQAEKFLPLLNTLKTATMSQVMAGRIFRERDDSSPS